MKRSKIAKNNKRRRSGSALIEAIVGISIIFIPLILFGSDAAVMFQTAHANEEFAEQLARLCAGLQDYKNAQQACNDVVRQYQLPPNVTSITCDNINFDIGTKEVTVTTSMTTKLPVPIPGRSAIMTLSANAKQPIVSFPAPQ